MDQATLQSHNVLGVREGRTSHLGETREYLTSLLCLLPRLRAYCSRLQRHRGGYPSITRCNSGTRRARLSAPLGRGDTQVGHRTREWPETILSLILSAPPAESADPRNYSRSEVSNLVSWDTGDGHRIADTSTHCTTDATLNGGGRPRRWNMGEHWLLPHRPLTGLVHRYGRIQLKCSCAMCSTLTPYGDGSVHPGWSVVPRSFRLVELILQPVNEVLNPFFVRAPLSIHHNDVRPTQ